MQNLNTNEMTGRGVIVLNVSEMPQENISVGKGKNYLLVGDNSVWLKKIPNNSIDSIVTDPPAGISFMARGWDSDKGGRDNWIAWMCEVATECKRVLKPGGHAFVWAIPRTSHWTATAWENAGFEIRDVVAHIFGSGFPKSANIQKHLQKIGSERAGEFSGWGSALKPAREDWILMRKPLEKGLTIAENVLKYGTGGINIDESRVEYQSKEDMENNGFRKTNIQNLGKTQTENNTNEQRWSTGLKQMIVQKESGRFPANLIHDNSEEVRECFPETKSGALKPYKENHQNASSYKFEREKTFEQVANSGNASRFFKSIKQDLHCSLCYDTIDTYQLTKNICNNTNVNNVEKSSETTQAIIESTALKNATGKVNENLVQNVKSAGNLCDLCGTSIAQRLVAIMQDQSQESTLGELSMPEHKRQILEKCLVSFVELMGNTDTIPTMENLNLLFGYVLNAIEEYTQKCGDTKSEDKNQWKSLIYKSKASKSERNKGCEELYILKDNIPTEDIDEIKHLLSI